MQKKGGTELKVQLDGAHERPTGGGHGGCAGGKHPGWGGIVDCGRWSVHGYHGAMGKQSCATSTMKSVGGKKNEGGRLRRSLYFFRAS